MNHSKAIKQALALLDEAGLPNIIIIAGTPLPEGGEISQTETVIGINGNAGILTMLLFEGSASILSALMESC